jgi:hypothetical protein
MFVRRDEVLASSRSHPTNNACVNRRPHAWLCVVCCALVRQRPTIRGRPLGGDHQFVLESGVHDRPQARAPVRPDKGDDGPVVKFRV